eukprot:FR740765.1.p1 GENE.FR740765.1~~FR740765.1.p1  ORF type:complete len:167 (+),score=19.34 FR740765.1:175-675(+)
MEMNDLKGTSVSSKILALDPLQVFLNYETSLYGLTSLIDGLSVHMEHTLNPSLDKSMRPYAPAADGTKMKVSRSTNDLATAMMLSATSPAPSNKQSQTMWPSFVKRNRNDYVRDEKMSHSVTGRTFFSPPAKMNVGPTSNLRTFSSMDGTSPLPKTPKESSRGLFF